MENKLATYTPKTRYCKSLDPWPSCRNESETNREMKAWTNKRLKTYWGERQRARLLRMTTSFNWYQKGVASRKTRSEVGLTANPENVTHRSTLSSYLLPQVEQARLLWFPRSLVASAYTQVTDSRYQPSPYHQLGVQDQLRWRRACTKGSTSVRSTK